MTRIYAVYYLFISIFNNHRHLLITNIFLDTLVIEGDATVITYELE